MTPTPAKPSLSDRIAALPRTLVWGLIALLVIIVFFAVVDPALNSISGVAQKADRIERDLARDKSFKDQASEDSRIIQQARASFGSPARPSAVATPEALYRVVDRVLTEHAIFDATITERSSQFRAEALPSVTGSPTGTRFTLDVSFETDTETVLDVLVALEQAKEVSAIGRVRIDKVQSRSSEPHEDLVRVTLAPELWTSSQPGATP